MKDYFTAGRQHLLRTAMRRLLAIDGKCTVDINDNEHKKSLQRHAAWIDSDGEPSDLFPDTKHSENVQSTNFTAFCAALEQCRQMNDLAPELSRAWSDLAVNLHCRYRRAHAAVVPFSKSFVEL